MTIDKFGRSPKSRTHIRGPKGDGFSLTPEGNYDMQNKILCNLGEPENANDAATKEFVEKKSLKRTNDNDIDLGDKKIQNLGNPINKKDAVTKEYLDNSNLIITRNLALQNLDISTLKDWKTKCEDEIATNKTYHDNQLKRFGVYLFNYIHHKSTGRAVTLPPAGEGEYLNWEELFKPRETPPPQPPTVIEIPLTSDVRDIIMRSNNP